MYVSVSLLLWYLPAHTQHSQWYHTSVTSLLTSLFESVSSYHIITIKLHISIIMCIYTYACTHICMYISLSMD